MKDGRVVYCVEGPSGNPSCFHRGIDPVWGEILTDRVTRETATMAIVHGARGAEVVAL